MIKPEIALANKSDNCQNLWPDGPQCLQIASEIWPVCGVGLAEAAQLVFSIQGNSQTAWPGGNGARPRSWATVQGIQRMQPAPQL